MLTRRRVAGSRSAAIAVMLAAMVWFAGTSRVSADSLGITFDASSLSSGGPTFFSTPTSLISAPPTGLLDKISVPSTPTAAPDGFTIPGMNYTVENLTQQAVGTADISWKAQEAFLITKPLVATLGLDVDITVSTTGGATGSLGISASILQQTFIGGHTSFSTLYTLSPAALTLPASGSSASFNPPAQSLTTNTLQPGNYFVQLESDLNLASLPIGASVNVDPGYGVGVDPVPEPSSWLLFAILSTIMLAGLAGRRWLGRRPCGNAHFAATSLGG